MDNPRLTAARLTFHRYFESITALSNSCAVVPGDIERLEHEAVEAILKAYYSGRDDDYTSIVRGSDP